MSDLLAQLQALLDEPPSVEAFQQILALLSELDGPELETGLARADAGLRSWPDETRCAGEQLFVEDTLEVQRFAVLARKLEFEPSHAGCDPELVQQIAEAPELANLTILNLLVEDVDGDGAAAIANSSTLTQLKELRLGDRIDDYGLCAIAQSPNFKQLEQLEQRGFIAEPETAEILANSPHMAKLVDLILEEDDELGEDAYWALGMSPYIPAAIRAIYLDVLDEDTLRERAQAIGIECPEDSSKSSLIELLSGRPGA